MKLYNTLTRKVEDFTPLDGKDVRIYSCGPTVYDHIHIGNLSAFIAADTLRRALVATGYNVQHVMNFTDVDDKTIRRSQERYPGEAPEVALKKLTDEYKQIFLNDMRAIGNDVEALTFINATDSIEAMRRLITELYKGDFAYITDDGVYFSIEKYKVAGGKYGQLLNISSENTSNARIDNDEYDKESVHDFALWKIRKGDEPAWDFELDGHSLLGRPGWHIECSVMSADNLGQPFDIHTGGVDLIFPHHENEIAQSTAGKADPTYAKFFVHNEHLLVEGKKMSKSLNNFYTLRDLQEKGFDPMAFRLLVFQSHYRSQSNFSWENLKAAQNRLSSLRAMADLRWQIIDFNYDEHDIDKEKGEHKEYPVQGFEFDNYFAAAIEAIENDLNTPVALSEISAAEEQANLRIVDRATEQAFRKFLENIDYLLGLKLLSSLDISKTQKDLVEQREKARDNKDWNQADQLRDQLKEQGIGVRDTGHGQVWFRL